MSPLSPLKLRLTNLRNVRLPMAGETTPLSPREERFRATTRRCLRPHITPSQLQNLLALLPFHEASMSPLAPLMAAALKARRDAASSATSNVAVIEKDTSNSMQFTGRMVVIPVALVDVSGLSQPAMDGWWLVSGTRRA